jgi:hypothetical protein
VTGSGFGGGGGGGVVPRLPASAGIMLETMASNTKAKRDVMDFDFIVGSFCFFSTKGQGKSVVISGLRENNLGAHHWRTKFNWF